MHASISKTLTLHNRVDRGRPHSCMLSYECRVVESTKFETFDARISGMNRNAVMNSHTGGRCYLISRTTDYARRAKNRKSRMHLNELLKDKLYARCSTRQLSNSKKKSGVFFSRSFCQLRRFSMDVCRGCANMR